MCAHPVFHFFKGHLTFLMIWLISFKGQNRQSWGWVYLCDKNRRCNSVERVCWLFFAVGAAVWSEVCLFLIIVCVCKALKRRDIVCMTVKYITISFRTITYSQRPCLGAVQWNNKPQCQWYMLEYEASGIISVSVQLLHCIWKNVKLFLCLWAFVF